jgi:hypothetical protein
MLTKEISEVEKCCECKKTKPLEEFRVGGIYSVRCKECRRKLYGHV